MNYEMTKKERKKLKKIARRIVIQSEYHTENIIEYYSIIAQTARKEFRESNDVTLCDFLLEQFQNASKQVLKHALVEYLVRNRAEKSNELDAE